MTDSRFKLIKDRSMAELQDNINNAQALGEHLGQLLSLPGNPFWIICAGVDAYQEKRRRQGKGPPTSGE